MPRIAPDVRTTMSIIMKAALQPKTPARPCGRRDGLGAAVFGVTIDAGAQFYFPTLLGRGGYAIVGNIRRLPAALPASYRQLAR
jgi:nitric oxide reductase activation protein